MVNKLAGLLFFIKLRLPLCLGFFSKKSLLFRRQEGEELEKVVSRVLCGFDNIKLLSGYFS